jgi:hypothetical protein
MLSTYPGLITLIYSIYQEVWRLHTDFCGEAISVSLCSQRTANCRLAPAAHTHVKKAPVEAVVTKTYVKLLPVTEPRPFISQSVTTKTGAAILAPGEVKNLRYPPTSSLEDQET